MTLLTYEGHTRPRPKPPAEPYVYEVYRIECSFGPQGDREEVILVENEFKGRHILGRIGYLLVDEEGHIYTAVIGGYSRTGHLYNEEKKMSKVEILSFEVGNITVNKHGTGRIHATYGAGERKSFVFLTHDGQPYPSSVYNLEHYYIGEDFDGADLMEFSGMDYVRTVKRVVRKNHSVMLKELLEMLEGCLVMHSAGSTYVYHKNNPIDIGCSDVFERMRPYMSIKVDSPKACRYGIIEKQSLFATSKEMEKLLKDNEERFVDVYNQLKGA